MDYTSLTNEICKLKNTKDVKITTIGKSLEQRDIYLIRLGRGAKKLLINATHHALEAITADLVMRITENLIETCAYKGVTVYIVPMVNPDGVEIAKTVHDWQANARGVDLNHNYDAGFYKGKLEAAKEGITRPGPTRYSGAHPESEPESAAMAYLARRECFDMTLCFHSQGEVIYWDYEKKASKADKSIAERLARAAGYALDETVGVSSYSGYKDYIIDKLHKTAFTIEVGKGVNPLPEAQLGDIYIRNFALVTEALAQIKIH